VAEIPADAVAIVVDDTPDLSADEAAVHLVADFAPND
jgi:hypothetical protein